MRGPIQQLGNEDTDTATESRALDGEPQEPQDQDDGDTLVRSIRDFLSSAAQVVLPAQDNNEPLGDDGEDVDGEGEADDSSYYWDASTMAPLNAASAAAIARLRAFRPPPFPLWDRLPVTRRAAVLMLLYADRRGDLRVVITMRAASLRSFSGHAALPGGKADSIEESPYEIARREAWEEIGLPMDDSKIPPPFRIEHLCYLPLSLARTELAVRPCVAMLHTTEPPVPTAGTAITTTDYGTNPAATATTTAEESLIPRLDAKEVAAVFSAPFHNFLRAADEEPSSDGSGSGSGSSPGKPLPPGKWYEGSWTNYHDEPWRMHFFYVPVHDQRVTKPKPSPPPKKIRDGLDAEEQQQQQQQVSKEGEVVEDGAVGRYKVWGMTARMLVDAATIAYGKRPEFEHNTHFGDERLILGLEKLGRLGPKKQAGSVLTADDIKMANDASKM
ncbi:hypothetical protein B0T26DRAFT_90673 [Lasiosphaeria miniovina]|uniref:Nudix hydrolase domain-containing protein n=1 Tax=Lasiosphaeria miniovina TaxID=1954250 RepID=A0AA40BIT2_9PEZI|nr:uncharacterized protein B0T26DRAFT_90673 [Lasiosphaeria miniovina]KAK0734996.1 hypothetical protein B0T26DRAFT_90673 [Lasiosphaeria miniovina]